MEGAVTTAATSRQCPGLYCGWTRLPDGPSECGACPWGWRRDAHHECRPCDAPPRLYDWLYLTFMASLLVCAHWAAIENATKTRRVLTRHAISLHACAALECVLAAVFALLAYEPRWTDLRLLTCPVRSVADWYTVAYNPRPDHRALVHCTQEAAYPLYSLVCVFLASSLVPLLVLRPVVTRALGVPRGYGGDAVYVALYFVPVLVLVHVLLAGLVYYSFPYLILVAGLVRHAAFLADQAILAKKVRPLAWRLVSDVKNALVLALHYASFAFAVVAMGELAGGGGGARGAWPLLCLVPVPTVFFVVTVHLTDPEVMRCFFV